MMTEGTQFQPATERVTIQDVARACGMNKSTVSRALNMPPDRYPLRAETRKLILQKADELGYAANWTARALSARSTKQIGLLFRYSLPEMRGISGDMTQAFSAELEAAGYHLLFVPLHGDNWLQTLRGNQFDGCVIHDVDLGITLDAVRSIGLPAVVLNNVVQGNDLPTVVPDDAQGTRLAVEHLIGLGHRKIAYLRMGRGSEANHFSIALRRTTYLQAMQDAGLGEQALAADEPIGQFLDRVPVGVPGGYTALVLYSHSEGIAMLRHLHLRGLRCPQDVSLVSFNDVYPMADLFPAFTTISVPGEAIGRAGAQLLLEQLNATGEPAAKQIVLPETIVVRESTAPLGGNR
jgi:LacI family transcriptional regulator